MQGWGNPAKAAHPPEPLQHSPSRSLRSKKLPNGALRDRRTTDTSDTVACQVERFGSDFDTAYGGWLRLLAMFGFLKDERERIVLSDRGAFWLHAFEDMFSIDYVSRLWGVSEQNPWPEQVVL